LDGFGTELTSGELIIVEEVFSPDFNVSITILRSSSRLDGVNLRHVIVAEGLTVICIGEVTSQRDSERNNFSSISVLGTIITHKASRILYK
jgi:hypothetical protein